MTGFVGGHLDSETVDSCVAEMHHEEWYESESFDKNGIGLSVLHHGAKDPNGCTTWEDDGRAGLIFGVITNLDDLGLDIDQLFEHMFDDPEALLPDIDGTFLIVAIDGDSERVVIASDKLGTRQVFYIDGEPFAFGTEVGVLTSLLEDPQVDERSISDLMMIGEVWGDRTLVQGINFLPSGCVLEYTGGDAPEVTQYWKHTFVQSPDDSYLDDLVDAYQDAIADMAATVDGDIGLFLSGGLDSRSLSAALRKNRDFTTFTYDSNPAHGRNLEHAKSIADVLGVKNERVLISPDQLVDRLDESVQLTSGMLGLTTFLNLSSVFDIDQMPNVLMEAAGQGELLGEGMSRPAIELSGSPEAALYRAKHFTDVDDARRLLETDFDPMTSFREEVRKADQPDKYSSAMDCYFLNYYPRFTYASNPIPESQAGVRVPYANRKFLEAVARLPLSDRIGAIPFTNGSIPAGTSFPKLELVRRLDAGLEDIPYERTRVAPERPLWQHAAGFVVSTSFDQVREKIVGDIYAHGGRSLLGTWYRENRRFRERVDELLDAAAKRPYFNADEIRRIQREELTGEAEHMSTISGIVTGELWVQKYIDRIADRPETEIPVHSTEDSTPTA
ncbi:asparagine synthase-related protein [Haloferax sp. DFSO52]|uniref:asparagine synthase-related protein n=1 Tax=Haloferax sp. DFSO52 TaxID=3388505 RepID=UPI003A864A76